MGPFSVQMRIIVTPSSVTVPYYVLEMTALAAVNLSKKVFVYRRTDAGTDVFDGIASPTDLLLIPEDAPDEGSAFPTKFRSASYTKMDAQPSVIETTKNDLQDSIDELTAALQTAWDFSQSQIVFSGVWGAGHNTSCVLSA